MALFGIVAFCFLITTEGITKRKYLPKIMTGGPHHKKQLSRYSWNWYSVKLYLLIPQSQLTIHTLISSLQAFPSSSTYCLIYMHAVCNFDEFVWLTWSPSFQESNRISILILYAGTLFSWAKSNGKMFPTEYGVWLWIIYLHEFHQASQIL